MNQDEVETFFRQIALFAGIQLEALTERSVR